MDAGKPTYFLSYSSQDADLALRLAHDLRRAGANIWIDQLDIVGGDRWDEAVESALRACGGLVVVLSPRSVTSRNVMDEVAYALDQGKTVVPAWFEKCEIPFRLRRIHYVDFAADYSAGLQNLLRALGTEIATDAAAAETHPPSPARRKPSEASSKVWERWRGAPSGFAALLLLAMIAQVLTQSLKTETRPLSDVIRREGIWVFLFPALLAGVIGAAAGAVAGRNWRLRSAVIVSVFIGWGIGLAVDPRYEGTLSGIVVGALAGIAVAAFLKRRKSQSQSLKGTH